MTDSTTDVKTDEAPEKTPEELYQEEYDKAWEKLEAEAGGGEVKTTEEDTATSEQNSDEQANDEQAAAAGQDENGEVKEDSAKAPSDDDPLAKLQQEIEGLQKRLSETQQWGHTNAAERKRLEKKLADLERLENRPAILDHYDDLEDAIKFVTGAGSSDEEDTPEAGQARWMEQVTQVHPDFESLVDSDDEFFADIQQRMEKAGDEWNNPLIASRHISEAKQAHLEREATKTREAAIEQARKDFAKRTQEKSALSGMPGASPGAGGGGQAASDADKVWAMSDEAFAKEKAKVLGL